MRFSFVKYINYILLFFGFFIFPFISYAAISNNPVADSQIWVQLTNQLVSQNGNLLEKLTPGTVDNQQNAPVYITECIDTADDRVCTTGTVEGDTVLYQSDENLRKMQTQYGYTYQEMTDSNGKSVQNPVTTDTNGNISPLYVQSTIAGDVIHKFYSVNLIKGTIDVSKLPNLEKIHTGYSGGQQQAAFEVKVPTPLPTQKAVVGAAAPKRLCDNVTFNIQSPHSFFSYLFHLFMVNAQDSSAGGPEPGGSGLHDGSCDPYGRVFDAVSLEPIPNAKVTLLTQRKDGSFTFMSPKETTNAIINPWTTKEDGKYTYLLLSGIYQLMVDIPNYTFPFIPSQLNPNYMKAYSDLYYASGYTDKNIVENGVVEHRDIPVISKGEPYRGPVKLLGYMSELDKKNQQYIVTGRTSHPLTIVEIQGKQIDTGLTTRVLVKTQADKWGFFSATISTSIFKPDETIGMVKMTKVDLTQSTSVTVSQKKSFLSILADLFTIFPRSSSFAEKEKPTTIDFAFAHLNPLLNYLEGYAYDSNDKPIPNAEVTIYLIGSKKPYYETEANEKGYYFITSQHLPQMNYSITYVTPDGKSYPITQTTFLEENIKTILANNLNLNKYLTQISPFKVAAQERMVFSNQARQNKINPSVENTKANTSSNNNILIYISSLFLIGISGIVGIVFYLKNKQKSSFTRMK